MTRYLSVSSVLILLALASTSFAEVTYTKGNDNEPTIVRMTVTPAAEPVPALRYRLVTRDFDLQPGNAAPYYYRAMIDLPSTFNDMRKKYGDAFDDWYDTEIPLTKAPFDKVREANESFDPMIRGQLKVASSRRNCDWELGIDQVRGPDLISFLLPEFQQCRQLARVLVLRARLAVAEQRYEDAIESIRMTYRIGRDSAQPLLVCGLIGIAIDQLADHALIELIAHPGSPNMYWALGELPNPPIDLRSAVRFEMGFGSRMFPLIQDAETADHSPQEWSRLLAEAIHNLQDLGGNDMPGPHGKTPNDVESGFAATAVALSGYSHAKEQLIAQGMDPDRVEKMAVGQVIAIYTERTYRRLADDWENLWQVPYPRSIEMARRLDREMQAARPFGDGKNREILPLATLLLPALQSCRGAQVRLDREVASIRVIEALRIYAAGHDGRLPKQLADIDSVPVPVNPATEKPFVYRLDGNTAILDLPVSDGIIGSNYRYEIQIASGK